MKKLLIVVGLLIFGIFMLVVGFNTFRESKKLQKDGKSVTATVVDGEERRGRRGRKSYSLTVSFAKRIRSPSSTTIKASGEKRSKCSVI